MFGKLKDKLKKSLSIFSKKTEEESEVVKITEEVIEQEVVEESKAEKPKTGVENKIEHKEVKKEEPSKRKKIKEEDKKEKKVQKKLEPEKEKDKVKRLKEEDKVKEEKEKPKKSFLKTIFARKEESETPIEKVETKVKEKEGGEKKGEIIEEEKEKPSDEKKSFFRKVKQSFTTKTISTEKFEELFWDLEITLLENNVSVEVIEKIKTDLKEELVNKPLPRDVPKKIEETLKQTLTEILSHEKTDLVKKIKAKKGPFIITFFGINGTGKTTSIAKLTHRFQKQNLSVVLAACDTFRAAAIQQLEEHANRLKVKIIKHNYGSDAAAVAYDAIEYAKKNNVDVVMIDTAGRLHSNTNLMAELEKIIRITKPDLKIFVGESITGNDCIEQAKRFNDLVEMDGIILTKVDVDDKGGAPLSISYTIGKPILFLGVGQEYKDLEEFDSKIILKKLGF